MLDDNQPASKLVRKIADRIIQAVQGQEGGGYQSHIKDFQWWVLTGPTSTDICFHSFLMLSSPGRMGRSPGKPM